MSAKSVAQNTLSSSKTPKRRALLIIIILLSAVGLYTYLYYSNIEEGSSNNNLYRILYEATNTLNQNIDKLKRGHDYNESETSIRSLLPSYQRTTAVPLRKVPKPLTYTLAAQQILIRDKAKESIAKLEVQDILPTPKAGFSQYLFASKDGAVLASAGHEKTISIVDLTSINQAFLRQESRSLLSMADAVKPQGNAPLPSYSSHIDITLSYGKYRVFAFPFALDIPISYSSNGETHTLNHLYLLGLMPRNKLIQQSTTSWNASLLVVSSVSLLFVLCLLRLYLLPITHSITVINRTVTHLISYGFFIVVLSLLLAYFQKYVVRYNKDHQAIEYAQKITQDIEQDVYHVFDELNQFRGFYQTLLDTTQQASDSSAKQNINSIFKQALEKINFHEFTCPRANQGHAAILPLAVSSADKFSIDYECTEDMGITVSSDFDGANLTQFLNPDGTPPEDAQILDFFTRNIEITLSAENSLETHVGKIDEHVPPLSLLNVFLLNKDGAILTPSFYFVENNVLPEGFELSNRDYFKKIRDHQGWALPRKKTNKQAKPSETDISPNPAYQQAYIQRLLNVNNATRGTTISMPLYYASDIPQKDKKDDRYASIIAADVILPNIVLAQPAPMDLTFMVVDRDDGQVLFHSDASRAMVENIYYSGNHSPILDQRIRAALDSTQHHSSSLSTKAIKGFYHGQAGRFFVQPSLIDKWAVLVFYPDDSLDALMTSQFMFLCISFAVFIVILATLSGLLGRLFDTDKLKQYVNLPATFDTKEMLHLSSTLIGIMYCLFTFTHLAIYPKEEAGYMVWLIAISTVLLIFYFGYRGYKLLFESAGESFSIRKKGKKGALFLACGLGALAAIQALYLDNVMTTPLNNLTHYYHYQQCNKLNREHAEIAALGLTRFPNSITKHRMEASHLLFGAKHKDDQVNWTAALQTKCADYSKAVMPDDFPGALDLLSTTQNWPWLDSYMSFSLATEAHPTHVNQELTMPRSASAAGILAIIVVLLAWLHFNRVTLWQRLYYSPFFLRHIRCLNLPRRQDNCTATSPALRLQVDSPKPNGIDLVTLLTLSPVPATPATPSETDASATQSYFAQLLNDSPYLQTLKTNNTALPNIKMALSPLTANPEQGYQLELWDIEVCLEVPKLRRKLLALLMELKSLALLGKIKQLTLYCGFYSLQRVKMKDPLASFDDTATLAHADYLSWADCLLDFTVHLPPKITQQISPEVLNSELTLFADLACLFPSVDTEVKDADKLEFPFVHTPGNLWRNPSQIPRFYQQIKHQPNQTFSTGYWATINYIILVAGPLYRYKWELCSNAEKLALYNLAKGQYINPKNSEMIEHLALAGLIKVERRHITFINHSFAHFVRHAESPQAMSRLISDGEAGTWKNYRLPLGLLLLLIIGGVAMTSGQSLYIIAASLAGVIGTIASLTSSANMLRGHLKE
ncbi:MAG: hypothetical protein ACW7DS_07320 [Paraglaciecola chathamensis]